MFDSVFESFLEEVCGFFSSGPSCFSEQVVESGNVCVDVSSLHLEGHKLVVCGSFLVAVGVRILELLFEVCPEGFVIWVEGSGGKFL
jgi:hypothetical protein